MPRVEFEPTIPVFERAKTVYALDRTATVIGLRHYHFLSNPSQFDIQCRRIFDYTRTLSEFVRASS
jgi:hypothetical protein